MYLLPVHRKEPTSVPVVVDNNNEQVVHVQHFIDIDHMSPGLYISDMYLHGRGLAGMWSIGALDACKVLIKRGVLTLDRIHGYSFGARAAVMFICDIPSTEVLTFYHQVHIRSGNRSREFCQIATRMLDEVLPVDAYLRCRNTVYIGYTVQLPFMEYKERTRFHSNAELIRYVVYSMSIPGITAPFRVLQTHYIDGAFGNRLWGWCKQPDQPDDDQQYFINGERLNAGHDSTGPVVIRRESLQVELFPPWFCYRYLFEAADPHVDLLVVRGCIDMFRFLSSGHDGNNIKRRPPSNTTNISKPAQT